MGVSTMMVVNVGLAAVFVGGGLLLLVAVWWARASDGVGIARDRWPTAIRALAMAGWALWLGGFLVQLLGYFGNVGVARW